MNPIFLTLDQKFSSRFSSEEERQIEREKERERVRERERERERRREWLNCRGVRGMVEAWHFSSFEPLRSWFRARALLGYCHFSINLYLHFKRTLVSNL